MADDKSGSAANPFGLPNLDFDELLGQFQLPGVDMDQLVEQGRKNIEAVQQANQAVIDGWQAITEKQADVFRESMEGLQKTMSEGLSGSISGDGERRAELAREGFETALENVRQLAEIAADSQSKAFEIMRQRFEENMQAMLNRQTGSDD